MPTAAKATADVRNGRMIKAETETAEIPIKKTAQVVLPMGSASSQTIGLGRLGRRRRLVSSSLLARANANFELTVLIPEGFDQPPDDSPAPVSTSF
jgi:hypothetical protein